MTAPAEALFASLGSFTDRLAAALGTELISVTLFGGAAKGRFDPATSDVNLMLVLNSVSIAALDQVALAAEPLRREYMLSLLTLTEGDLGDSAEIFPTKFLDIQRHHRTLWGREVADSFVVPRDRLQRQAARQLINLHLRLRQVYLDSRARPEALDAMLRRSVTTLLINLGILLELKEGRPIAPGDELLAAAASAGLDRAALAEIVAFKRERRALSDALPVFYEQFMQQVEAAYRLAALR
jgi:predicted nucleotidyltransferase